jgi:hypothetical protein
MLWWEVVEATTQKGVSVSLDMRRPNCFPSVLLDHSDISPFKWNQQFTGGAASPAKANCDVAADGLEHVVRHAHLSKLGDRGVTTPGRGPSRTTQPAAA